MSENIFEGAEIISSYSRREAIADGVLVDVASLITDESDFARQAGFVIPVALTSSVADLAIPNERERAHGQDLKGRLWDILNMARIYGMAQGGDTARFPCSFWVSGRSPFRGAGSRTVHLKAVVGPGDDAEPVMTIMQRGED
jgi:hypothetical protein